MSPSYLFKKKKGFSFIENRCKINKVGIFCPNHLIHPLICIMINSNKKRFQKSWEEYTMGTIVCQTCLETMEHFEEEKVTLLYADCGCGHENGSNE